jgi:membrane protease YdiL (CAAX protease family)
MTRAASNIRAAPSRAAKRADPVLSYFRRAALPLHSLAFILPLIVIYELGTRFIVASNGPAQRIIAFNLMQQFFSFFGATARYLPALAVIGILLAWHVARRDAWQIDVATLLGMVLESVVLAVPLMAMGVVAARYAPMYALANGSRSLFVLSIGAGIYEELVFRLIAFTVLSFVLSDVIGVRIFWCNVLMVAASSILFAAYHYLGSEAFQWRTFAFRTVAGAYFGAVFVWRGFGVTAGSHTAYDMILVLAKLLPLR